jgi:hypothetical protein
MRPSIIKRKERYVAAPTSPPRLLKAAVWLLQKRHTRFDYRRFTSQSMDVGGSKGYLSTGAVRDSGAGGGASVCIECVRRGR